MKWKESSKKPQRAGTCTDGPKTAARPLGTYRAFPSKRFIVRRQLPTSSIRPTERLSSLASRGSPQLHQRSIHLLVHALGGDRDIVPKKGDIGRSLRIVKALLTGGDEPSAEKIPARAAPRLGGLPLQAQSGIASRHDARAHRRGVRRAPAFALKAGVLRLAAKSKASSTKRCSRLEGRLKEDPQSETRRDSRS